jgi:hypothetical protein
VFRIAAGGILILGLLGSAETGLLSPVALSVGVALVTFAIGELDDPGPVVKSHKVRRPGMTEREVYRRLTMSNEIQELKKEEQEKARRKARRKRGGGRL